MTFFIAFLIGCILHMQFCLISLCVIKNRPTWTPEVFSRKQNTPSQRRLQEIRLFLWLFNILSSMLPPTHCHPFEDCVRGLFPFILVLAALVPSMSTFISTSPLTSRLPFGPQHPFEGRNMFEMFRHHHYLFWLNTGELPETLDHLVLDIAPRLHRHSRYGNARQRQRRGKLNTANQVLLVMIWLRKYRCLDSLLLLFYISRQTVSSVIYHVVPVLWRYFQNQITWPTLPEWNAMRENWSTFHDAVGCIDTTPHEIYIPQVEPPRDV